MSEQPEMIFLRDLHDCINAVEKDPKQRTKFEDSWKNAPDQEEAKKMAQLMFEKGWIKNAVSEGK